MKTKRYNWIVVALTLGCATLGILLRDKSLQIAELKNAKETIDGRIQKEALEISRQVDSTGIETVIFDINQNKASPGQLAVNKQTKGIIDTTALALDLRTKQLKQILVIKSSLEAENLKLKQQLDASEMPYYTYNENGLRLKFTPPNVNDTVGHVDFSANVEIKATQFWRRNWILGARRSFLAISSDNPMFKINSADYLEIEQKPKGFGVKIQASSTYDSRSGMFRFGPAAQINLGRLSFTGHYGRNFIEQKWHTQLSASYDMLDF
jgi:hypothetical protein